MASAPAAHGYCWGSPGTRPSWIQTESCSSSSSVVSIPTRGWAIPGGSVISEPPYDPGWVIACARVSRSPSSISSAMRWDISWPTVHGFLVPCRGKQRRIGPPISALKRPPRSGLHHPPQRAHPRRGTFLLRSPHPGEVEAEFLRWPIWLRRTGKKESSSRRVRIPSLGWKPRGRQLETIAFPPLEVGKPETSPLR
jgi:hypothetical protein